jgi:hypothetical protein
MTLSTLRSKLPFRLASLHVRAHQDGHCEFNLLPRPVQLNVLADELASEVHADLRAADQPTKFYPLPACRVYLRDGTGYITSCENARSRTNSMGTKVERTSNTTTVRPKRQKVSKRMRPLRTPSLRMLSLRKKRSSPNRNRTRIRKCNRTKNSGIPARLRIGA